ncbi:hypothetical protein KB559_06570 [Paenibacillus sp. Marseille-P2973]|uniref:hypothetical protein n=1 Tax=Paenibacillus sp. Marseille-P2973 TaxID=1871032 RepID=UPI001B392A0F|nr:hypothetical protein [Paenibacillus sp. Marseille-P2973]MBQ4898501.1 hypothetical protein [Paenibacillus sp. Marseille-P2973]
MHKGEEEQDYTALFISFSQQAELWMMRLLICLIIALCLFQAALTIPGFRHLLSSAEKFEGVPVQRLDRH